MIRKFRGTLTSRVDGKGRMSVPAALRQSFNLGDPLYESSETGRTRIVAVYGPDWWNWLELYSMDAIDAIDAQIDGLPRGSHERRWLETLMNGQSTDLEIDREGRLLLPQRFRTKLGFEEGVEPVFESAGDYVKLYHPADKPKDGNALEEFTRQFGPEFDPREFVRGSQPVAMPHAPAQATPAYGWPQPMAYPQQGYGAPAYPPAYAAGGYPPAGYASAPQMAHPYAPHPYAPQPYPQPYPQPGYEAQPPHEGQGYPAPQPYPQPYPQPAAQPNWPAGPGGQPVDPRMTGWPQHPAMPPQDGEG